MKYLTAVAALTLLLPVGAMAQTAASADDATEMTDGAEDAAGAKFSLDTPVETIAADEQGKAVLNADLPDLLSHPSYEFFKGMSLRQLQPMSEGKLTDEIMAKVEADLAGIE